MGLDMYLLRKTYVKNWDNDSASGYKITVTKNGKPVENIDVSKITEVTEEFGYWRKANAIHKWFVDNVQGGHDDCGSYHVNSESLRTLVAVCKSTLENADAAHKLLPTAKGFFFGGEGYDDHYKDCVQYTIELLEQALSLIDNASNLDSGFYYHSSW